MQNIPDNQLDNFFKEALENPGLAFNAKAWNSMEKKLDKALIRMLWVNRIKYMSLILLTISVLTFTWLKIGSDKQDVRIVKNKISELTSESKTNSGHSKESLNSQSITDVKKEALSRYDKSSKKFSNSKSRKTLSNVNLDNSQLHSVKGDKSNLSQSSGNHLNLGDQKETVSTVIQDNKNKFSENATLQGNRSINKSVDFNKKTKENTSFRRKDLRKDVAKDANLIELKTSNKSNVLDNKQILINSLKEEVSGGQINELEESKTTVENYSNIDHLKPLDLNYSNISQIPIHLTFNQKIEEASIPDHIIKNKTSTRPLLRLSGLISPDFSSYLEAKMLKSGYNTGFSLELFPVKRFSVSGSILKSKKVYSAKPGEYKPYAGFWEGKTLPKNIEGECKITDLQLNLRYYVVSSSRIQVFAGTGMSSYLMRHEIYTYDYTTWEKTIHISKKNNHYFSIINLSAGLEHKLGNRLAFGIEPFIKVPVTGIGAGKIKLNSGGVFLSLTYLLLNK